VLLACLAGFVIAFVGALPVAGPVAVLLVERALAGRLRESVAMAAGAAVPEGIYATAACLGAEALLASHPRLVPLAHGLGALFLLGIGISLWRGARPATGTAAVGALPAVPRFIWASPEARAALTGLVLVAVNPTLLVTWSAASAPLVGFGALATPLHAVSFGVGAALGGLGGSATLAAVAGHQRDRLGASGALYVQRGAAVFLVGFGLVLALQALPIRY
jgi:threonine/homoserine/homoserine lactone efflux protein